jgi:hypothetical protein
LNQEYAKMLEIEFADKFIAYIDVLGFKSMVEAAEGESDSLLLEVIAILRASGSVQARLRFDQDGPTVCPMSKYIQRNLNFRASQISDCVIVSSEVSPAGAINLLHHCWQLVLSLMRKGVMCRGYITRGVISHSDTQFYGTGYQRAYASEGNVAVFIRNADERGTPFVEIDPAMSGYIDQCDKYVQEIFCRFVKRDRDLVALFPFQALQHSFIIGDAFGHQFDLEKERQSNRNVRNWIADMRERVVALVDKSNPSAMSKSEHYIQALDDQLAECDSTEAFLVSMK